MLSASRHQPKRGFTIHEFSTTLHSPCNYFTVGRSHTGRTNIPCLYQETATANFGRDDWIRTSDLTHPKGTLYQAEPHPDT